MPENVIEAESYSIYDRFRIVLILWLEIRLRVHDPSLVLTPLLPLKDHRARQIDSSLRKEDQRHISYQPRYVM